MNFFTKLTLCRVLETRVLNSRNYTRWSHRQPKRVLTSEEYDNMEWKNNEILEKANDNNAISKNVNLKVFKEGQGDHSLKKISRSHWLPKTVKAERPIRDSHDASEDKSTDTAVDKRTKKKRLVYKTLNDLKFETKDMLETVIDADGNFVYTKLPDKNADLGQLLLTVKSRKQQIKRNLILLEGKRLIKEALEANCKLNSLVFSRKSDIDYLIPFLPKSGAKIYKIPYREIQMWSDLSTTPGIMGIFNVPKVESFVPPKDSFQIIVVCDNVREPGNLGAILRTSLGAGVHNIILTKGCVDLWDTKVLRSACGAHFQLQIHSQTDWSSLKTKIENLKGTVLIADNKIASDEANKSTENLEDTISGLPILPYYGVNFDKLGTLVLIIGGESEGISGEAYRFAAEFSGLRLNIPLSNNVDSLNTGTSLGIILFEIKRQLTSYKCDEEVKIQC